jgi:hypothetical protein
MMATPFGSLRFSIFSCIFSPFCSCCNSIAVHEKHEKNIYKKM